MKKSKVIGFNPSKMAAEIMANAVAEQNSRLVEYAEEKIAEIGNKIASYNGRNHMDDTGNLLDSLCWGVCYDGKMVASGFYRPQKATKPSILHSMSQAAVLEGSTRRKWKDLYNQDVKKARDIQAANWSYESAGEPVNGHQLAEDYLAKASRQSKAGQWKVFFAILAPYWGYWEKGFKLGNQQHVFGFLQFSVMTEFYDKIKADLKPAKTRIHVSVAKYASKSLYASAKKNLKNPYRLDEW